MKRSIVTTTVFLVLLGGISVINLFTPDRSFSENENRVLASFPEFSFQNLASGAFTKGFEDYITDQFVARDQFVTIKTAADLAAGKKDNGKVYFGKDGYLFQKTDKWPEAQLTRNISAVQMFSSKLLEKGCTASVQILPVPSAGEILKDKLPDFLTLPDEGEVFDALSDALGTGSVIDIRSAFLAAKDSEQLYYRSDHHWTTDGAYTAYVSFCENRGLIPYSKEQFSVETVSDSFLGTSYSKSLLPMTPDIMKRYVPNFTFSVSVSFNDDAGPYSSLYFDEALKTKDKYVYYVNGNHGLTSISTSVKNGKTLVLLKDSFANSMLPFLCLHYETIYMLDLRYTAENVAQFAADKQADDILFLYGIDTFTTDLNLAKLMR